MFKLFRKAAMAAVVMLLAATAFAVSPKTTEGTVPSADGVPIHYAVTGDGPLALVFVHGWSCDDTFWSEQVAAFAPKYRVVTVDMAGHGRSGRERKEWTIPAFGLDVKAVVEKLGLERVVLIGHSMGGSVAVSAAGAMPGRVVAIIGVDTLQDAAREIPPAAIQALVGQMTADFPGVTRQFVRQMFPAGSDTALVSRVAGKMASAPAAIAIPVFQSIFAYDLKAGFAAAKAPIRVINSDQTPTNLTGNRAFAPDFDAVIMKGVGHFPHLERSAEFDGALGEVLAQVTAKEPSR